MRRRRPRWPAIFHCFLLWRRVFEHIWHSCVSSRRCGQVRLNCLSNHGCRCPLAEQAELLGVQLFQKPQPTLSLLQRECELWQKRGAVQPHRERVSRCRGQRGQHRHLCQWGVHARGRDKRKYVVLGPPHHKPTFSVALTDILDSPGTPIFASIVNRVSGTFPTLNDLGGNLTYPDQRRASRHWEEPHRKCPSNTYLAWQARVDIGWRLCVGDVARGEKEQGRNPNKRADDPPLGLHQPRSLRAPVRPQRHHLRHEPRLRHRGLLRRRGLGPGNGVGDTEFPADAGAVFGFALAERIGIEMGTEERSNEG